VAEFRRQLRQCQVRSVVAFSQSFLLFFGVLLLRLMLLRLCVMCARTGGAERAAGECACIWELGG
jgi:hypothetical protein